MSPPTFCRHAIDANRKTEFRADSRSERADDAPTTRRRSAADTDLGAKSGILECHTEFVASWVGKAPAVHFPKCCVPEVEIEVGRTLLPQVTRSEAKLAIRADFEAAFSADPSSELADLAPTTRRRLRL